MSIDHDHDDDQDVDSKPGMMRRQLIAALNQPADDGGESRLQKILDALIGKAEEGDLASDQGNLRPL